MIVLSHIYTRLGDDGTSSLGTGLRRSKADLRFQAIGAVDEANVSIGMVRAYLGPKNQKIDVVLQRVQNDLFDVGADLAVPDSGEMSYEPLRVVSLQAARLEEDIDSLNENLPTLRSFVLPAGTVASVHLHFARTVVRRAERTVVAMGASKGEIVNPNIVKYLNRLSDLLFVAARYINIAEGVPETLWTPGGNKSAGEEDEDDFRVMSPRI